MDDEEQPNGKYQEVGGGSRWSSSPKQCVRGAPGEDACQSLHGRLPTHSLITGQAFISLNT